jgi:hypothetical protein
MKITSRRRADQAATAEGARAARLKSLFPLP